MILRGWSSKGSKGVEPEHLIVFSSLGSPLWDKLQVISGSKITGYKHILRGLTLSFSQTKGQSIYQSEGFTSEFTSGSSADI